MAVTNITITQDNKVGNCDLLSVHNPLVFLAQADYTGEAPEYMYVDVKNVSGTVLGTFACIPYEDVTEGRVFAFIATDILRAFMEDIDDFESEEGVLEFVDNITMYFTLKFYIGSEYDTVSFTAIHAAGQYGASAAMEDIYNNTDETYYAANGMPVYIYFYNADTDNILNIDDPDPEEIYAVDYDDTYFTDFDDLLYKIL